MNKNILAIGIVFLFIVSSVTPMVFGYNIKIPIEKEIQVTKSSRDDIDWWPMFRHDLQHSGYSTSRAPDYGNVLWSYKTGDSVRSSPAVVNGKVYIGSFDSNVYCLNADNGTKIWSYLTGDWVRSSPAVTDGKVYIGSCDNYMYCLNAENGTKIWSYKTGDWFYSSPAVVNGKVYIGHDNDGVYCLNAENGEKIWRYQTEGSVTSSPAVVNGKVYVGDKDDYVYCLNAENGDIIWSYKTGWWVTSSPAVVDGKVYIGSQDVCVYCFNAENGEKIWRTPIIPSVSSSPAVADGKVFISNSLYCLNAENGNMIWSRPIGGEVYSSPAVADDKVYVGSKIGNVYCFNQPPNKPVIIGRKIGKPGVEYEYKFSLHHLWGYDLYCYIDWNDGNAEKWIGPYASGYRIVLNHTWKMTGTYLIKAKTKDIYGAESDWSTLKLTLPRNRIATNTLFLRFLEHFPILQKILNIFL